MTFPLCPPAARVYGDVSRVKTAPGLYPRPGMGELELYCFFPPTPDTFIYVKQPEPTYMQRLIAASVSTRVFAFRVHKLVQLYRIGSDLGASVREYMWVPRSDGPKPPRLPGLIRLNCLSLCKDLFFSLSPLNHRISGTRVSCVFEPAIRASPRNCPSFIPVITGAISGPRSAWIQSLLPLSASVLAL